MRNPQPLPHVTSHRPVAIPERRGGRSADANFHELQRRHWLLLFLFFSFYFFKHAVKSLLDPRATLTDMQVNLSRLFHVSPPVQTLEARKIHQYAQ